MLKFKKFVNRGLYFINNGDLQGSFILNIKEKNTKINKAILIMPDLEPKFVSNVDIKSLFENKHLEYVKTLPKKVYEVCLLEFNERLKVKKP